MKIYLAGDYNQPQTYAKYAQELERLGFHIVSRWLGGPGFEEIKKQGGHAATGHVDRTPKLFRVLAGSTQLTPIEQMALNCCEDMEESDIVIVFEAEDGNWEAGYASARGKEVLIIGGNDSPFYYYGRQTAFFPEWQLAKEYLHASRLRMGMLGNGKQLRDYMDD